MSEPVADWTEPGAFEVAPGVHRIPLPMPNDGLRAVNIYVIASGDGCVLIDSGWALAEARTALEQGLGAIGYGFENIQRFLITHMHRDHYTLGIELQRLFGAKVAIGAGEQESIERSISNTDSALQKLLPIWGAAGLAEAWMADYNPEERAHYANAYGPPDEWIADGQLLAAGPRTLTAIQTPGHTRGHLVYLDAEAKVMFTGDHVLPRITPSIGLEPARLKSPLTAYLSSLRLMLTHADARMLPAHGPLGDSVHVRVHELIKHHDVRLEHTLAAVAAGAGTPYDVARAIGWTRRETPFDELTQYNKILAVGETQAHLVVLTERAQLVQSVDGEGNVTFEIPPA